ncbi:hypothetical protein D3C84_823040 [compost metagenome]
MFDDRCQVNAIPVTKKHRLPLVQDLGQPLQMGIECVGRLRRREQKSPITGRGAGRPLQKGTALIQRHQIGHDGVPVCIGSAEIEATGGMTAIQLVVVLQGGGIAGPRQHGIQRV